MENLASSCEGKRPIRMQLATGSKRHPTFAIVRIENRYYRSTISFRRWSIRDRSADVAGPDDAVFTPRCARNVGFHRTEWRAFADVVFRIAV